MLVIRAHAGWRAQPATALTSAVVLSLLFGACGVESATPEGGEATADPSTVDSAAIATPSAEDPAGEVDCEALGMRILEARPTRTALLDLYGPPDSVSVSVEPNRHIAGATDSLFVVHYAGLTVHIRTPPGGRDLVSDVRVENSRYLADPRIGIGAEEKDVLDALGEPMEESENESTYECGTAVENPVTFAFRDGRVASISISYYVD